VVVNNLLIAALITAIAVLLGLLFRSNQAVRRHKELLTKTRSALTAVVASSEDKTAQWQATLSGMLDGLMVLDGDLRLLEWNQNFPKFVGVPADILHEGMPLGDILRAQAIAGEFGPVDVEQEVRRRLDLVAAGISTGTIVRTRPNGQTMELRRSPLAKGGFVTLYTDITDQRRIEDQLRQSQKMEAIGQLTGGIAHDFNNLLTVVVGNLEMARDALQASNPLRAHSKLEAASGGAQRGAVLTQRLLAFSRRQILEPKPVDPNRIVSDMSELIRHSIGNISLQTVLAGEIWHTVIDQNQLENVLLNLAINARDAMPDGGKITIETANAYLDATYAAAHQEVDPGQYVLIAVTDEGTGMSPEHVERAFEPFFTTKGIGKGSGLGLSQVFGFVKQSKGHVKIYSELGSGTTVKLYLPRLDAETIPAVETAHAPPEMLRARDQETILVVEDDPDVLAYATEALKSLGYNVIAAREATSALNAFESNPNIKLLLTDVGLPGMNGPELVEKARDHRPNLPVLYTTAYPAMATLRGRLVARGVKTLNKPFVLDALAAAVRDAIDNPTEPGGSK
jgi:signal transduction histidine kinase/ActR/RegA family two-component response regulator